MSKPLPESRSKPRFRLAALGERGLPFLALMAAGWVFLSAAELPGVTPGAAAASSAPAAAVGTAPAVPSAAPAAAR